jgi:hypothetical protein
LCQRIVFVVLTENSYFEALEGKLDIVDAVEMSENQIMTILDPESMDAVNFTFFELMV